MDSEESFIDVKNFRNEDDQKSVPDALSKASKEFISVLVFRINARWLALETAFVKNVAHSKQVYKLPHQKNPRLLGIVNWNGELLPAISSDFFFNPDDNVFPNPEAFPSHKNRMVAIEKNEKIRVFSVEEVIGVHHFLVSSITSISTKEAGSRFLNFKGRMIWNGLNLGLLDGEAIFKDLQRHGL